MGGVDRGPAVANRPQRGERARRKRSRRSSVVRSAARPRLSRDAHPSRARLAQHLRRPLPASVRPALVLRRHAVHRRSMGVAGAGRRRRAESAPRSRRTQPVGGLGDPGGDRLRAAAHRGGLDVGAGAVARWHRRGGGAQHRRPAGHRTRAPARRECVRRRARDLHRGVHRWRGCREGHRAQERRRADREPDGRSATAHAGAPGSGGSDRDRDPLRAIPLARVAALRVGRLVEASPAIEAGARTRRCAIPRSEASSVGRGFPGPRSTITPTSGRSISWTRATRSSAARGSGARWCRVPKK